LSVHSGGGDLRGHLIRSGPCMSPGAGVSPALRVSCFVIETGAAHGIDVQVVSKDPGQKGFALLPRRWAGERAFGWWMLHRRLARDYEALPERSVTMIGRALA
jgi:transposase